MNPKRWCHDNKHDGIQVNDTQNNNKNATVSINIPYIYALEQLRMFIVSVIMLNADVLNVVAPKGYS
jgi:hypothetical protein